MSVLHGDMLAALPAMASDSFHSCVTDPPYHLTTGKRGGSGLASANLASPAGRARIGAGFMGKAWDGGDIAFRPETWAEVLRVLKPGAHLVAFGGTRTFHRMAVAIEDAGFELRDTLMWVYGSGFPKSHDVSKGIDRAAGAIRSEIVGSKLGRPGMAKDGSNQRSGFDVAFGGESSGVLVSDITAPATPEAAEWAGWGTALKPAWEPIILARKPFKGTVAANVLRNGCGALNINGCRVTPSSDVTGQRPYAIRSVWEQEPRLCSSCAEHAENKTKPEAPAKRGSSATSPAALTMNERGEAPLLDISRAATGCCDGTRVEATSINSNIAKSGKLKTGQSRLDMTSTTSTATNSTIGSTTCAACGVTIMPKSTDSTTTESRSLQRGESKQEPIVRANVGRWPSNLIHDGSDEVVAAFPAKAGAFAPVRGTEPSNETHNIYGARTRCATLHHGDTGSAARFFYCAKATKADRAGSKHPTVKPLALIRHLVRLVTPPGGVVLDCFAGTGTTGRAALAEGFDATLVENEREYVTDIRNAIAADRRRMVRAAA